MEHQFKLRIGQEKLGCILDVNAPVVSETSKENEAYYQSLIGNILPGDEEVYYEPIDTIITDLMTEYEKHTKFSQMMKLMNRN